MRYINQIVFIFSLFITCLSHAMWTDLHQAASDGNLEQVQHLLNTGADIDTANQFGWTPLHEASERGREAIVKLLLNGGANINAVTKDWETPLDIAKQYNGISEVATLLKRWPKYQNLLRERKEQMYAFLMATHSRLGVKTPAKVLYTDLFKYIWEFVKPPIEEADNFEEKEQ